MKTQKKKKLKKNRIIGIFFIIIIVFFLFFLKNIINSNLDKKAKEKTRLLLNNEIISLKDEILKLDNNIYVSEEDIQEIFDNNIYYNVGDQELITTYNNHVAVLHLDSNQMKLDDSIINITHPLKQIDSKIYLPFLDLGIVYDLEVYYSEKSNLVIADSLNEAKIKAIAIKNTKLKKSKMLFSRKIENVSRGDTLYILKDEKKWQKVRTTEREHRLYKI